ncbi:MAG: bifunctional transcriptional regulator/O6-methylguanine-DNA methyltransferase [Betaproteobacteria bacterium]|nr:bifunctional transcriptional regulator/O6-methylguanine-DNA methyltransferase [Betaproteobacteria bacterium]
MFQGMQADELLFDTGNSSIGPFLVASSRKGICAVLLADDEEGLIAQFRTEFPDRGFRRGGAEYRRVVAEVEKLIESPHYVFLSPIEVAGDEFDQMVWAALRNTRPGPTVSLAEIARTIGASAGSERLVEAAIGRSRHAVLVPTHRVVDAEGKSVPFRWGAQRQRELLAREIAFYG